MYTEHEHSGGGDGKPEFMKIEYGIAMMPMIRFVGGCEVCQKHARIMLNTLMVAAMSQAANAFSKVMTESRGECAIEIANAATVEVMMREKLGNEVTDKFLEIANGGV